MVIWNKIRRKTSKKTHDNFNLLLSLSKYIVKKPSLSILDCYRRSYNVHFLLILNDLQALYQKAYWLLLFYW